MRNFSFELNFVNCFNLFNTVLKIFGISSLRHSRKGGRINYQISFCGMIHSVIISMLVIYITHVQITKFTSHGRSVILTILRCYLVLSGNLMTILLLATGFYSSIGFVNLLNDPRYKSLFEIRIDYSKMSSVSLNQLILSLVILLSEYIPDLFTADEPITFSLMFQYLIYFIFPVYNVLCISQFSVSLFWWRFLQMQVNEWLAKLIHTKNGSRRNFDNSVTGRNVERGSVRNESLSEEICRLRDLCHKLYGLCKEVDNIYAARNILLLFHHSIIGVLYSCWALRHTITRRKLSLPSLLNMYRASLMSFVYMIWIIWPSKAAVLEGKKTAVIVNEMLISKSLSPEEIEDLHIFSVQLLKERPVFAPYDFFTLSNETLLGLLGTFTSYLIIILQYDITTNEPIPELGNSTFTQ